jgi:hypothetical protein
MATKLVKILQKESGPFNESNNLVSIDMEPGNMTDLSKSYLHCEVNFLVDGAEPQDSTIRLGSYETKSAYSTASIVKHATLRSDVIGLVEQQRFNNVYQETTRQFMESTENKKASVAFGNNEITVDPTGLGHMLIPLDKLFGCAKSEQLYPDYRLGQSRIELELENQAQIFYIDDENDVGRFEIPCNRQNDVNEITGVVCTQPFSATAVSQYFVVGREYLLTYTEADEQEVNVTIANVARADNGIVTLTFTEPIETEPDADIVNISISSINIEGDDTYECENQDNATANPVNTSVFTVQDCDADVYKTGQTVQIGYLIQTLAGLAPGDTYSNVLTKVVSSVQAEANVTLTVEAVVVIPAQSGLRHVFMFGPGFGRDFDQPRVVTWSISKVELIQAKPLAQTKVDEFVFKTNLLENVNHPGLIQEFRRQIQLDSGTDLVTCINPVLDPLLGSVQFDTYRNSLNSVDTITKDVQIDYTTNGSIYFDRLMYAYPELRKLQPLNGSVTVAMIAELIEPEQQLMPQNIVEFRLRHTGEVPVIPGMLYFYKRLTKSI